MRGVAPLLVGLLAALVLAAALVGGPAAAENLIANPHFPKVLGIGFWTVRQGTAAWDTFECGFTNADSGSAYLESGHPLLEATLEQCVPVLPGTRYRLAGSVYSEGSDEIELRMRFIDGTCAARDPIATAAAKTTERNDWVDLEVTTVAPPLTDAVVVELRVTRFGGSPAGYFDDIELPEPTASGACGVLTLLALRGRWRLRTG